MEGILLVNKPKGPTSFQIIKKLRKVTGERKIGHSGTLDPNARGLLIVLFGKATKHARYFENLRKRYLAKILLGVQTDTDDILGNIISQKKTTAVVPEVLKRGLSEFTGKIRQIPPRFSAVKFQGKRAYALARKGKEFALESREVSVHNLRLIYYNHPFVKLDIECSKGTYIRSIARDLGNRLGIGATLHSLLRAAIGEWSIREAINNAEMLDLECIKRRLLHGIPAEVVPSS